MSYRELSQIISDRRNGEKLSVIIEKILASPPYLLDQIDNPFDLIEGLHPDDFIDTTGLWFDLPVELQIKFSSAYQTWYARHSGLDDVEAKFELVRGTEMHMMLVPPMRDYLGGYQDHGLTGTHKFEAFWMGKYEVTQEQWDAVMSYRSHSAFRGSNLFPVDSVTHAECGEFCDESGMKLPSEERWEMACRAGTTTRYSFGDATDQLENYAWFYENADGSTHEVGKKKPNAWGLHDMHGNVSEICDSRYIRSIENWFVTRGGNWHFHSQHCTSVGRYAPISSQRSSRVGFRVWSPF